MPAVRSKDQSERKSVQLPCGTLSLSSVQVGRLVGQVVTSSIYHTEKTKGKRQQGVKTTKTRQDKTMVEEPLKVTTPHSTGVRQASLCGGKEGREKLCGVCVVCVLCVWLNQWNQARDMQYQQGQWQVTSPVWQVACRSKQVLLSSFPPSKKGERKGLTLPVLRFSARVARLGLQMCNCCHWTSFHLFQGSWTVTAGHPPGPALVSR